MIKYVESTYIIEYFVTQIAVVSLSLRLITRKKNDFVTVTNICDTDNRAMFL